MEVALVLLILEVERIVHVICPLISEILSVYSLAMKDWSQNPEQSKEDSVEESKKA